jgi:hypothetical protein
VIEALAALLGAIVKAIPGLEDHRARQKRAEIGAELISFYNEANRMLVAGDSLIHELRIYEHAAATGKPDHYDALRKTIALHVRQQIAALREVAASYKALQGYLGPIITNDAFRDVSELFNYKEGFLIILAWHVTNDLILDVGFPKESSEQTNTDVELKGWVNLPLGKDFGPQYLPIVQAYFRNHDPEAELEQISARLEEIRKAILVNFELEDLLLKVKDIQSRS